MTSEYNMTDGGQIPGPEGPRQPEYSRRKNILPNPLLNSGYQLLFRSNFPEAAQAFSIATLPNPTDPEPKILASVAQKLDKAYEGEAIELLEELIDQRPDSANILSALGFSLVLAGHRHRAEETYLEALQVDPKHLHSLMNLGQQYTHERSFEKAERLYQRASATSPAGKELLTRIAELKAAEAKNGRGFGPEFSPISVLIHTRNSIEHIEDALRCAIASDAEEVLVADMDSTDGTKEVAERWADRVIQVPPSDYVEKIRAISIAATSHDWVWLNDADERIRRSMILPLRRYMRDHPDVNGYLLPYHHYDFGKLIRPKVHIYPQPRLIDRNQYEFVDEIHRGLRGKGGRSETIPYGPKTVINHYRRTTVSQYVDAIRRYTPAEAHLKDQKGEIFSWQGTAWSMAKDLYRTYEEVPDGYRRTPEDLILAFFQATYKFAEAANLLQLHKQAENLKPEEREVPPSIDVFLRTILRNIREIRKDPSKAYSNPIS